jgi:hypothetical protein
MSRYIHIGSRITGWHAVKSRVEQLQLEMTEAQIKDVTAKIKELADVKTQSMEDVDAVLRIYHRGVSSGIIQVGQKQVSLPFFPSLPRLTSIYIIKYAEQPNLRLYRNSTSFSLVMPMNQMRHQYSRRPRQQAR